MNKFIIMSLISLSAVAFAQEKSSSTVFRNNLKATSIISQLKQAGIPVTDLQKNKVLATYKISAPASAFCLISFACTVYFTDENGQKHELEEMNRRDSELIYSMSAEKKSLPGGPTIRDGIVLSCLSVEHDSDESKSIRICTYESYKAGSKRPVAQNKELKGWGEKSGSERNAEIAASINNAPELSQSTSDNADPSTATR